MRIQPWKHIERKTKTKKVSPIHGIWIRGKVEEHAIWNNDKILP